MAGYAFRAISISDGSGPFPTLIYNHGSRAGFERRPSPWVRLAGLYGAAGYALLVPERRGYGRSDGPASSELLAAMSAAF